MLSFFRFLRGYLWIRVCGYSPERFMNLCCNYGILLWNISPAGNNYEMCISLPDFYRIRPIVRKTGTNVCIMKKCGFPFRAAKWKKRKIFIGGCVACLVSLIVLSGFIWKIELNGNQMLTEDMFADFLLKNKVECGMSHNDIDIDSLEKALRNEYNFITWTSMKIEGTKLRVYVKENSAYPVVDRENQELPESNFNRNEKGEPIYDLVASKDGIVESIITRYGTPMVEKGSEVKAGDVLISGAMPIIGDHDIIVNYRYCGADGDIILKTGYNYDDKLEYKYEEKHFTGQEKNTYFITFFHMTVHFLKKPDSNNYTLSTTSSQLKLNEDFYLPVYFGTNNYKEYEIYKKTYSKDVGKELLKEKLNKFCNDLEEKGVQIIGKSVKIEQGNSYMRMFGSIEAFEAAVKKASTPKQEIPNETEGITE